MKRTITQKEVVFTSPKGARIWKVTSQTFDGIIEDDFHTKEDLPMDKEIDLYEIAGPPQYPRILTAQNPAALAPATQQAQQQSLRVMALPSLASLMQVAPFDPTENEFTALVNTEPPAEWVKTHPMTKNKYMDIGRVEYLMTRIYGGYSVEVKEVQLIANSVVVTVRVHTTNPITGKPEWQDGIGAQPLQTNQGAGAADWNAIKSAAVQMAAPSAESYAIKDACQKFGKIFGRDVGRKPEGQVDYGDIFRAPLGKDQLQELFNTYGHLISDADKEAGQRILDNEEVESYGKLQRIINRAWEAQQ